MKMSDHKHWRRIAAGVCAAAMCFGTGAVPAQAIQLGTTDAVQVQADALKTRDVLCSGQDVNRWESEHFQFIWGKNGADSAQVTEAFLQENAAHLEACYAVYMDDLQMEPPTQSVDLALRDGNQYKVNFYISGTGLDGFTDDWAYMAYDREGFAYMFCCVGAMQNSPNPSWVLPHEFGHVVTAHQRGWNANKYVQSWWESIGNWYREQFLYSDYYSQWVTDPASGTDYFETYMKNLCFTPILGRDNYASWAFLQYLTENPDGLPGYGKDFMRSMMQQGEVDEYPYLEIERLSGADLKETLGNYAKRLATLDLAQQERYLARQEQLLSSGAWNWGQIYTLLEQSSERENFYTVPTERAPQQFGINLIPLAVKGDAITVTLEGLTDVAGADWRACIVVKQRDGETRYSKLFSAGEQVTMPYDAAADAEAYLTVTATPDTETLMQVGVPWAYNEGEFDEDHVPFLSKTRYPYAVTLDGAEIQQERISSAMLQGSHHPNGGGFVAATAQVDDSVYVGENARVLGYAKVSGNAVIDGYATVTDSAQVSGNAIVTGHAVVAERAQVKDNAIVADYAGVTGSAVVSENARVLESGMVYGNYAVSGNASVKGVAFCMADGAAGGQAIADGDYYDDSSRTLAQGSVYGWASPDTYVNSRPYSDGQYAGLEFTEDSSRIAVDTYTSTYAAALNTPLWEEDRTSGKGVLTFTDTDQKLIADSSYAALHDADYQTAVLMRGNGTIFRFGDADTYMTLTAKDGAFTFIAAKDGQAETLTTGNVYNNGEWVTVSLVLSGDDAKLVVNGETAAAGTVTLDPAEVISTGADYTIGGSIGSMDFFRVNFKEVAEPEYYYTETEEVLPPVRAFYVGDMDGNEMIDTFDLALLKYAVLSGTADVIADCDGNGSAGVGDVVAMQRYLLGQDNTGKTGMRMTE